MYLSRIRLDNKKRETYKFLCSQQVAHATIEGAFFDKEKTRKLWRLDYYQGEPYVLILSKDKPNFSRLASQFGYSDEGGETKDYQKVLNVLAVGQVFRFRLCANPVHSISMGEGKRGKVVAHVTVEQQANWLVEQSLKHGFVLKNFSVVQRDLKKFKHNNASVTIATATYEGCLEITNVEEFKQILLEGLGRSKAYGCGLLTLAK